MALNYTPANMTPAPTQSIYTPPAPKAAPKPAVVGAAATAAPKQATVFTTAAVPQQQKVVNVGDPHAFDGGYQLSTPTNNINTPSAGSVMYAAPGSYDAAMGITKPPASSTVNTTPTTPTTNVTPTAGGTAPTDLTTPGGSIATPPKSNLPTTSTAVDYTKDQGYLDAQQALKDAQAANYKQAEYDKQIADATAALDLKYARLQQDAQVAADNEKAGRFSDLAGVGVNPLSSGAANVSGDVAHNLSNTLSNLALQKSAELAQAKSAILGQQTAEQTKAVKTAQDTAAMIRQSALDRNAQAHLDFQDATAAAKNLADEAKSNYDFSKEQTDDAAAKITDIIKNSPEVYKNMSPTDKAATEKRAGWAAGQIDATIAKNEAAAKKAAETTAAKTLADEKEAYIKEGYLYVSGPSKLGSIPKGSDIQYGANGAIYFHPPKVLSPMQVAPGTNVFDPNTNKVIYTAPTKKTTGVKGASGTFSQTPMYDSKGQQVGYTLYNSKTGERKFTDPLGQTIATPPSGARVGGVSFNPGDTNALSDLITNAINNPD